MAHIKVSLLALVAVVAMVQSSPIGDYGGVAQSYSSISSVGSVISAAPSYVSAAPAVVSLPSYSAVAYEKEPEIIAYPRYAFKYGVQDGKTGDVKDQAEERDGDVVKGEYSLLQPDGRKRVVNYLCDKKNGCNQVVSYLGEAVHPQVVKVVSAPVKVASIGLASLGGLGSYGSSSGY